MTNRPIANDDIQAIVALCHIAGCGFQRRPDEGGYVRFWVWKLNRFSTFGDTNYRAAVYGLKLEAWQAAIQTL